MSYSSKSGNSENPALMFDTDHSSYYFTYFKPSAIQRYIDNYEQQPAVPASLPTNVKQDKS